jgi:hypothetical protein
MLSAKITKNRPMTAAFTLPADRTAPPRDLEVRPKAVKAWVEALPLAQSIDTAKQLCMHVSALNRAKIDTDDRVQILESYRPITTVLFDELDAVYAKATVPLGAKAREALMLARELASQVSIGYRIAIADRGGKLLGFGKKQLPLLTLRAMEACAAMLRASYKSYTPVPEGLWRQIHQLYLDAERERIVAEVVDADTKEAVINVYVETLLLALTDPYRLSPGEVDKVSAQIRSARAPVTLGQSRPATRSGGHFIVPCDTDKPPKPALSANDDTGGAQWRLLDCNPLVDKMRLRLNAMETGNVSATTRSMAGPETLALLRKLITLWGDPPKRAYRRVPATGTVAICMGLKAVTHFVSLEPRDPEAEKEMLQRGITVPMRRPDFGEGTDSTPVFEYDVVNESEGGLKVRRTGATPQALGVGEVIGVKQPSRPRWTIGVVRWITGYEDGGMEFGVQFLALSARVVMVQPTIASSGVQPRPGLLLADDDDPSRHEVLLAAPNTFSELREFELESGGEAMHVRARALREKTARFDVFDVSPS